ncbi:MAG: hypothetical protein J5725_00200 [Bacteroidales bacterium]|nr:hypothetical protein [Bacteroidales bacterium]
MAIQEVKRIHTANPDSVEDPKIIKIARLSVILADKSMDQVTKSSCLRLAVKTGIITKEEADQLALYQADLEAMLIDEEEV